MNSISASRASRLTRPLTLAACVFAVLTGPVWAAGLPKPDVAIALRDGRFLHLVPLPFGSLGGIVVGRASFDSSGTRAALLATFPGAGIGGSWRSANPTQAFLVDAGRRIVIQLTSDGFARDISWDGSESVRIRDAANDFTVSVGPAAPVVLPAARIAAVSEAPSGSSFVSGKSTDRLAVYKTPRSQYVVEQIGAVRFRISGTAANGAYAVVGSYLAWIDRNRHIAAQLVHLGLDNAEPLSFSNSPYGDALVPIRPLGSPVYQASYRGGVVYFSFSHGVERIVAATTDLVNYRYPKLPHEPVFSVGIGFGRSADGAWYFVRPEEDVMLFTLRGRYVRRHMAGLDAARDPRQLESAMRALVHRTGVAAVSPLQDALDQALAQWRFYPVGDANGERWVASRLGHLMIGDDTGRFALAQAPAFPFALLGRTDDGRLWGASPLGRTMSGDAIVSSRSTIWWSRDAVAWHEAAVLDGDAGAAGAHGGEIWVAGTRPMLGRSIVCVARLDSASPQLWPTAASYAGEELSFADLSGGFYLLFGATPGWRLNGAGGPLSAFRLDAGALSQTDSLNNNQYVAQLLSPDGDASLPNDTPAIADGDAILAAALADVRIPASRMLTVRTNVRTSEALYSDVVMLGLDQARAYELKYAAKPYPLLSVIASVAGADATITRTLELGPLHGSGSVEQWEKRADGWHRRAVLSRFSY